MSKIEDGGPAFPVPDTRSAEPGTFDEMRAMARGMSLRDHFAAKAMAILWDAYDKGYCGMADKDEPNIKMVAEGAYQLADAMLAARSK
jgi:hypothetical protein